jgi:hypothetical protein
MTALRPPIGIPVQHGTPVGHAQSSRIVYRHQRAGVQIVESTTSVGPVDEHAPHHAEHRSLVAVDIAAFGDLRRDDEVQRYVRKAMYEILREGFDRTVGWESCRRQDRGDGVLVVTPPRTPIAVLVGPLFDLLRAGLRHHNKMSSDVAQIRLRMAVHAGSVLFDSHGVLGHSLTRLFDLLEAPAFKTEFTATASTLGLVTSDYVYDDVIRHCSGDIDPDDYHSIEVMEQETPGRAWVRIPPGLVSRARPRIPRARSAPAQGLRDMLRDRRDVTRAAAE